MKSMKIGNPLLDNLLTNAKSRMVFFYNHMAIQSNNRGFCFCAAVQGLPYYYTLVQNRQNMSVKMKVSKDLKQKMSLSINVKLFPMNKNGQLVFR